MSTEGITQVREAYECLRDEKSRAKYDRIYSMLQDQWTRYKIWQKAQREDDNKRQAQEEDRAARERAEQQRRTQEAESKRRREEQSERERKAAEAERRRKEEEIQATRAKAERERKREERERLAEERTREAARRAREEQEQAARERIRKQKEKEAAIRSEEAATRTRIEQERAAQERLKSILIEERQEDARRTWANMREAAERRRQADPGAQPAPPGFPHDSACAHPRFGWPKKKGRATCMFCGEIRRKWLHRCPDCEALACPSCMLLVSP